MAKDILLFAFQLVWCGILQLVGILTGFVVVPLMLLFGRWDYDSKQNFTQFNTNRYWCREVFPKLFWPWDNAEDSSIGDKRGWWDANSFGADATRWINRFWWMAIRNPFNNFKRYILGVDVRDYVMLTLAGQRYVRDDFKNVGWQFVKAIPLDKNRLPRYAFYGVWRYGSSDRAFVLQLGNKVSEGHNGAIYDEPLDYFKGFTIECNPFKDIS